MNRDVRTWVEIDAGALRGNAEQFLRIIPAHTRLMAVVKSNAYGHDLVWTARVLSGVPEFRKRGWFGVDSLVEGLCLRREGIKNPILTLGYTLPSRMREAGEKNITLTISSFEALRAAAALRPRPALHVKIDTGMHRQGFLPHEIARLIRILKKKRISPAGVYTHFASAKYPVDPAYTSLQFGRFQRVISELRQSDIRPSVCHAAASGGTLMFPETHLDMVRVGMGLYGYPPSPESKRRIKKLGMPLRPVLAWKTIVSEIKKIPKNSLVGYDGAESVRRNTRIAILPVGYWHGYDRGFSKIGRVLIGGMRCRILGRVSMDMIVVDITDIPRVRVGDEAVLIGRQKRDALWADDLASKISTTQYELLTRINPLMRRILV